MEASLSACQNTALDEQAELDLDAMSTQMVINTPQTELRENKTQVSLFR